MLKKSLAILLFSYKENIDNPDNLKIIGDCNFSFIHDDLLLINKFIELNKTITKYEIIKQSINQLYPLLDYKLEDYRIEPGAIIRSGVFLGKNVVVLMNSTINVNAYIDDNTMIDMGAVIGSSAHIGKNCHIGANAVIAGVLEPYSSKEVVIEDNVFVGASSVILEGIKVGKYSIIGASSLVTKDVPPYSLVMGVPAKVVRKVDERLLEKCQINSSLR